MKVLYGSQELWDIVERGYTEVENQSELTNQQLVELRENRKKDKKALFFIYQVVMNLFSREFQQLLLQRRLGIF